MAGWLSMVTAGAGEPARGLASGPQIGDKISTFYVRAVTGPLKSKSVCYVCRNGDRPVVMLFIRQITPGLQDLLKGLDAEIDRQRGVGLRGFGVFVPGEIPDLFSRVQTLSFDEKLNLPLTIAAAPADGSAGGAIHPEAAVTVVLYRDLIVKANFACRADELNAERIAEILEAVRQLATSE
ncbi:MAG: hypothetical protein JSS02_09750 [Planctomycetes bacterium]|nr:hypothetical protein [Planctomycetota bacterium]